VEGTSSEFPIYQERKRVCDLGYLREPYAASEGTIAYRCAAEPVANYVSKAARLKTRRPQMSLQRFDANIGHGQVRKDGVVEPPLVTTGDDLNTIAQFLQPGEDSYGAADVVASLLSALPLNRKSIPPCWLLPNSLPPLPGRRHETPSECVLPASAARETPRAVRSGTSMPSSKNCPSGDWRAMLNRHLDRLLKRDGTLDVPA